MSAKLFDTNNSELMAISALERDGDELVIRGKIYGAMPMKAKLRPDDARALLKVLNFRIMLFILSLPFRRGRS
jgi:hypothetical protein